MDKSIVVTKNNGEILNLEMRFQRVEQRTNGDVIGATFLFFMDGDIANRRNPFYQFRIESFNGCSGIAIIRDVFLKEEHRGYGLAIQFLNLQEQVAKDFGYSAMMCSVVLGNHPQQKTLHKNAWEYIKEFDNKRSGNRVRLYYKKI